MVWLVSDLTAQTTYREDIERWRAAREQDLRSPEGWLSLAGLFMLDDGLVSVGSDAGNRIVLPPSAPAHLGTLDYRAGMATLTLTDDLPADATVEVGGAPIQRVEMVDNRDGRAATIVKVGSVRFNLHKFGNEVALRVRDTTSKAIQEFAGCRWYDVKPEYCVQGRFVRESVPTHIAVTTSVKTPTLYDSIGTVEFELLGQPSTLLASAASNPHELFIILRDATAGDTTYGAGRYLYAPVDDEGVVTLDFNKAYNPPCAFTPYATCSWPPAENIVNVAIEAGERF